MARLYGPGPEPPPPLISTADLAGLSTADVNGRPVGELVGTLSEERSGLIRYLDVGIRTADRHVLVPIGHTRIDQESVPPRVRLRAASHEDLLKIPPFVEDQIPVDPEYQERVMEAHGRLFYGSRYYAHPAYDHSALTAGAATIFEVEDGGDERRDLRPLSDLTGFRIAHGAPGLVGWPLSDRDGERVGTISELLIEPAARRARYAVVDLADLGRSALLPIGYLDRDDESEEAHLPTLTVTDVRVLPPYEAPLTRDEENRLHAAIEGRLTGDRYFDRADFRPSDAPPSEAGLGV